jgi:NAD(P)-dependent dehydrogenase (short-subunit alcohol dehydrogenase family)
MEAGMHTFAGKLAVVTGGGSGIGRELVCQLVAEGCHVAMCDISAAGMTETRAHCRSQEVSRGIRITSHLTDVSDEAQVLRFRDALAREHNTDKIHLLFNNAGIGGGGSLFSNSRVQWEKTFNICWGGVYYCTRAFLPMLLQADAAHIVNTSSVNGFWASVGPNVPHTAYCAAKFAVKGFSEALIADLQVNAPHVKCSVVMPGHIGTSIVANSRRVQYDTDSEILNAEELAQMRIRLVASGRDLSQVSDADLQALAVERARQFRENAPTTAASAATIILDGVRAGRWRILVGNDAHALDAMVRETPEEAYEPAFFEKFIAKSGWRVGR